MYYVTRDTNTNELKGVHYNSNIKAVTNIDTRPENEAIEITEAQYQNHVNKELNIPRYRWENNQIVDNVTRV